MKRKFLILTLCFTIIFSSINYKKSYAMDLVVTPAMFYTLSALTVAYGLSITDTDALYNLSRDFYEWSGEAISDTISIFNSAVSIGANGVVTVGKSFLDKFDSYLKANEFRYGNIDTNYSITCGGFPTYYGNVIGSPSLVKSFGNTGINESTFHYVLNGHEIYYGSTFYKDLPFLGYYVLDSRLYAVHAYGDSVMERMLGGVGNWFNPSVDSWSNPLVGQYDDSFVKDNTNDDGSIDLVLDPNVDSLIGKVPSDIIYDGTNSKPYDGSISIPNISNPSISVQGDLTFPGTVTDNPSIPDVDNPSIPDNPSIDGILPSFPSFGDSLDFSPMYLTNVTEKFPFSLPWDIGRLIEKFDVEPVPPVFEVPIFSETITLDLTEFSELSSIVRFFVLVGFILSLIFISTKLMA